MAGDWLKMRHDLPDDPAVITMSSQTGLDEDAIVGRLHRLWSWADRQLSDGVALGVSTDWIDRLVHCDGFAAAMVQAGWLEVHDRGVCFPKFDVHMGESAKLRAKSSERQKRYRALRSCHAHVTPKSHIPADLRRKVFERDGKKCVYCGWTEDQKTPIGAYIGAMLSVDHVIPESRGGDTSLDNLTTCCTVCNRIKSDRTPEEAGLPVTHLSRKCHAYVTHFALPEKRREEERPTVSPSIESIRSGDVNWVEVLAEAQRLQNKLHLQLTPKNRGLILKAIVLVRHGPMPEAWLAESVQAVVDARGVRSKPAYFTRCLSNRAASQGFEFAALMAAVDVPAKYLEPKKESDDRKQA